MAILQSGMAKSGNYWLYKILTNILRENNNPPKSFIQNHPIHNIAKTWELSYNDQADIDVLDIENKQCFYRISSIFREAIDDIDDYVSQCNLVWTHSKICSRSKEVFPKFSKIVYIIRDPRDVAISMARFAFTPYYKKYYPHTANNQSEFLDDIIQSQIFNWIEHVGGYLKNQDMNKCYIVFYENLLHNFDVELQNVLNYLGVELTEDSRKIISNEVSLTTMRKQNPNHVRKGDAGGWKNVLSKYQKKTALVIGGKMMRLLNYPMRSEDENGTPNIPDKMNIQEIENIQKKAKMSYLLYNVKRKSKGFLNRKNG